MRQKYFVIVKITVVAQAFQVVRALLPVAIFIFFPRLQIGNSGQRSFVMFDDDVTEHEIVTSLLSFFLILPCDINVQCV